MKASHGPNREGTAPTKQFPSFKDQQIPQRGKMDHRMTQPSQGRRVAKEACGSSHEPASRLIHHPPKSPLWAPAVGTGTHSRRSQDVAECLH